MAETTVFNRLLKTLNFSNSHKDRRPRIIKADSPQELMVKKKEVKQQSFMEKQFANLQRREELQNRSLQPDRRSAFMDFESMEYYPTIAAALDIMAEEATAMGDTGDVLNIYSESPRVKSILNSFFYDTVEVNYNLFSWTRNMLKYGDNFLYLRSQQGQGITQVKQLPVIEVHRHEKYDEETAQNKITFENDITRDTYNNFQVAHFRLLSDDRFYPYGMSVLNKVRVTWLQLTQTEDAMMVYRISRASERRVVKVNVGNADDDDIPALMQIVANQFKKTPEVNREDGTVGHRYNSIPVDEDIFMPVRNDNTGSVIDTLPGASNLDQISDIEYLKDNLFTGLGVPKSMLNYSNDQAQGGKNLAQEDVRFARRITRIQQAILQELYKMAIIHLYTLGMEDDVFNFSLTMNNPSIQQDMLRTEDLKLKVDLYQLLTDKSKGPSAMSDKRAKQMLFNMSEEEIIQDLQEQLIERVVVTEFDELSKKISDSTIFEDVKRKYRISDDAEEKGGEASTDNPPSDEEVDDLANDLTGGGETGVEMPPPADMDVDDSAEMPTESFKKRGKLLAEQLEQSLGQIENRLKDKKPGR